MDQPLHHIIRGAHDIVTDGTGRKLRVHLLGTLVFLELDLDAGFLLKHFDGGGIQIFAVV